MLTDKIVNTIKSALDSSPRQAWTAELHLQSIKYYNELKTTSGKEFTEKLGIQDSYATEFLKMKKIASRLVDAGLNVDKI